VDCDQIVRDELLPRADVVAAVAARFGREVLGPMAARPAAVATQVFATMRTGCG
jgi:dephospho-CoA kinase